MLAVTLYNAAFHPQKGPLRRARFVHRLRRLMVTVREILDYTGLFILQYRKRKLLLFIRVILETKCTETVELHIVVTKILDNVHRFMFHILNSFSHEDSSLLSHDVMSTGKQIPTFRRSLVLPSSA